MSSNGQLPTVSVSATHGNRGTKEEEEELKQERDDTYTALELTDVEVAAGRYEAGTALDPEAERQRQIDGLAKLMRQNPEIAATA